ncbi:HAMP domain-containing sensor histidine kinase [Paenibacillus hodogayensis]|uniref:histidine kinase n=1 Tax=Paenibacillus hodogayensis TaxID=279208 RepID=A0ABV5VZR4_9BACL
MNRDTFKRFGASAIKWNKGILAVLNWRRSIRGRILWSTLLSFVASMLLTMSINNIVVTFAAFLLFFFLLLHNIVAYIRTLADGLMLIARGNLDYRIPLSRHDELRGVAQNINFMTEQLQLMLEKERQIEKSKMELITNVSHDLRTPLTSMIGYLNLLKNDDYADLDEHKRYIQNTYNKTQQLKKLIDDLFDYTRLTSGSSRFVYRTVDISELLEQIRTEFEPIAQEHSLTISCMREQEPLYAEVDAEQFVRAIDNLLMNALKFSRKPGEIAIRLSGTENRMLLSVENQGIPITTEQERLLFERFYKAEASRHDTTTQPGAGLGLSIARSIVELHGGTLGLDHRDGSFVFHIELPLALPAASDEAGGPSE